MFIEVSPESAIVSVGYETHSRGFGYLALDRRRTFLFVATSLRNIAAGIDSYANEEVGRSTIFSVASFSSKRGYAGNFQILRCERAELPERIQEYRSRFERLIVCATLRSAWKLQDAGPKVVKERADVLVVESLESD